jgi:hypothetical protein|tara:strand:+ start:1473 stop:1757 length:285 start_codon:yes stop_codon:yes gene_type:complete
MEKSMEKNKKKYIEHNNDLAFNLSLGLMKDYVKNCLDDKSEKKMDPVLGAYLLVHNLSIGLLFTAEGCEQEVIAILKDAIDDAEYKLNKSRKVS